MKYAPNPLGYLVEVFPWNKNFEVGVSLIDEQHQRLVELLNVLIGHLAYQSDMPTLNNVFNDLVEYAAYHFQTEETIANVYVMEFPTVSVKQFAPTTLSIKPKIVCIKNV